MHYLISSNACYHAKIDDIKLSSYACYHAKIDDISSNACYHAKIDDNASTNKIVRIIMTTYSIKTSHFVYKV